MNLTQGQQASLELLETSLGIRDEGGALLGEEANPALCASLKREENLQYHFMLLYQSIILLLAVAVLALLFFAAWRLVAGEAFQGVVAGAGALVSGVAANFLRRQRSDARDAHAAAQAGLEKYHCH